MSERWEVLITSLYFLLFYNNNLEMTTIFHNDKNNAKVTTVTFEK